MLEVDFVAKKNNKIIYIQVTYLLEGHESTEEREQKSLLKIRGHYKKVIISHDKFEVSLDDGLKHVLLTEFLNGYEL